MLSTTLSILRSFHQVYRHLLPPRPQRPPRPAPSPPPAAAADLPQLPFEKYTLPNGLEVILHEDHRMPEVAVDVWYKVGARDEVAGRTGFAHLFEHVMFQGTKHIAEDKHFEYLQKAGRLQRQRLDVVRPDELLRGRPVEPARARAVARERSHGLPARPGRLQGDHRQPARRGQERAAPALREPAHGPGVEGDARGAVSAGPSRITTRSSARWRT